MKYSEPLLLAKNIKDFNASTTFPFSKNVDYTMFDKVENA